ncbi:uncharacterized protein DUF4064 [Staphylococcus auricularis]|uniref:DUF4064 domain-containing protein n=1 Tax=Staphylococcus auricularis TaxID=29379 RepID=A0AAP8PML8_9STAP|nr:DUF4064 domain-containing protein [Staphylococcus auricularis]MBM0867590.1 DUF4064 domain-containing protein [Staphylococcus auricularis]MDC6326410.1 DUF4064 domain-containing protein [Staphylococcus auricularis]MDN4532287.1 DUF4064 domain-containing protein [Staphylococcus auricularis]PNZ65837.1 DUF4064 domain-containing protein [Staphylococcus auricularis]QPT05584.1 DUF4064 domain-containing protein [Staphylococcus auricularis]
MSGEQFMQVKRPVSRLAEKVLGWLSWLFLLALTVITIFIALVSFSSETSIQSLEASLNNNELIQQILANNGLNTTQFVIWLQNGVWAVIVYFIVCLLISFLALISMNIRFLSGFLFLVAAVVTLPLVLLFITLIIPILFFIIAIMMFVRKDRVDTVPAYYMEGYQGAPTQGYDYDEPVYRNQPRYSDDRDDQDAYEADNGYDRNAKPLRRGSYDHFYDQDHPTAAEDSVQADTAEEDDEPQILSRQVKYGYKNKVKPTHDEDHEDGMTEEERLEQERHQQEIEAQRQREAEEAERQRQQEAEEKARRKQEEKEAREQEKQAHAEEKARRKQIKKERKQREKELRKQQPSAVNQRRMNYEERKKVVHQDQTAQEETSQTTDEVDATEERNEHKE